MSNALSFIQRIKNSLRLTDKMANIWEQSDVLLVPILIDLNSKF